MPLRKEQAMNYQVPLYKLVEKGEEQIGTVIVQNTSLGAYDVSSGTKLHISTGALSVSPTLYQMKQLSPYVKKKDLNPHNLIVPEERTINKKRK